MTTNHTLTGYSYHRDRDGVNDTWDICGPDGKHLVSIPFWDEPDTNEAAKTEAEARMIVHRLNRYDELLPALEALLTAAGNLDAAIDGVTDQFDGERSELDAACDIARTALDQATKTKA